MNVASMTINPSLDTARADFPILNQEVAGKPLVYLDNAATTQKPKAVLEAMQHYYLWDNANVHRGVHTLSQRATMAFDEARLKVQRFINAKLPEEIIFVRGTTEAINLVAQTMGKRLVPGDEVVISALEHHANIVPWQMLREERGIVLRVLPIDDTGQVCLDQLPALLGQRTRLVAVGHVSNALGTVVPVKTIIEMAHSQGIPVLVDGAQAIPHLPVDVQGLDCDFYAFSGHKAYGPTGIGALYGKKTWLESLPPWQGGGDMIRSVSFEKTTYSEPPAKFEAGTPHIAGAIGMGVALDYLETMGMAAIAAHDEMLCRYAADRLAEVPGLRLIGTAADKSAVVSFVMEGVHSHDIGTILNSEGVAVRAGHHCAMPVMERFCVAATTRASFGLYNTMADVDALVVALGKVRHLFR